MQTTAVLLLHCPDRKGIVAAIANFLLEHDANIIHADQHQDTDVGLFFMRVEWDRKGFSLAASAFEAAFRPIAERFAMQWKIRYSDTLPRVALFVSKQDHCLADLLHRHRMGELRCDFRFIMSNHREAEPLARFHGIPFHHIAVTAENKSASEAAQWKLLEKEKVALVVLARYMQVLSPTFVAHLPNQIINVHHSFLPAFSGARPYHQAFERGVKLIGATSHYVTEVLDDGPIIEQSVERISHRDQPEDLVRKGSNLEKTALAHAVRWHLEHRVLVYGKKTVVFD